MSFAPRRVIRKRIETKKKRGKKKKGVGGDESKISVYVRVRPLLDFEIDRSLSKIVNVIENRIVSVTPPKGYLGVDVFGDEKIQKKKRYTFDKVFDSESSQDEVFEGTIKTEIPRLLEGFSSSIFCYGQTGSGKTYTMIGEKEKPGLMYLTVEELFRLIDKENQKNQNTYEIFLSYFEIYNENIRDLLSEEFKGYLDLREKKNGEIKIVGLSDYLVSDVSEVMELLIKGNEERTCEPNSFHQHSSRSHAVLRIKVIKKTVIDFSKFMDQKIELENIPVSESYHSSFYAVDLAGSEVSSSKAFRNARFVEGININKSLLALGNCINILAKAGKTKKKMHIPIRDSKLTRILRESLLGNCKTIMLANINPSDQTCAESIATLKYANRAKNIITKTTKKMEKEDTKLFYLTKMVYTLQNEVKSLKAKIHNEKKSGKKEKISNKMSFLELNALEDQEENEKPEKIPKKENTLPNIHKNQTSLELPSQNNDQGLMKRKLYSERNLKELIYLQKEIDEKEKEKEKKELLAIRENVIETLEDKIKQNSNDKNKKKQSLRLSTHKTLSLADKKKFEDLKDKLVANYQNKTKVSKEIADLECIELKSRILGIKINVKIRKLGDLAEEQREKHFFLKKEDEIKKELKALNTRREDKKKELNSLLKDGKVVLKQIFNLMKSNDLIELLEKNYHLEMEVFELKYKEKVETELESKLLEIERLRYQLELQMEENKQLKIENRRRAKLEKLKKINKEIGLLVSPKRKKSEEKEPQIETIVLPKINNSVESPKKEKRNDDVKDEELQDKFTKISELLNDQKEYTHTRYISSNAQRKRLQNKRKLKKKVANSYPSSNQHNESDEKTHKRKQSFPLPNLKAVQKVNHKRFKPEKRKRNVKRYQPQRKKSKVVVPPLIFPEIRGFAINGQKNNIFFKNFDIGKKNGGIKKKVGRMKKLYMINPFI